MNPKSFSIATAAAALFLAGAVPALAEQTAGGEQVLCEGINACKGQGACGGPNGCGGQNECKGHGRTKTTAADCKAKGGTVVDEKK